MVNNLLYNILNKEELILLGSNLDKFPMIKAASASIKKCNTCGYKHKNFRLLLRTAINKYHKNKEFIEHCKALFKLPCILAGILIEDIK